MSDMKSLSLKRPLVIMMLGIPGSGKSFFAVRFADMFGAPRVSVDRLRSLLFPTSTYSANEEKLLTAVTKLEVEELLKTQKSFIVDGGVSARTYRSEIEKMARAKGYGTLVVWVQTDEPTSRQRATKKRAKGDINASIIMSESTFQARTKQLVPPLRTEKYVVISGKHTFATQAKVVLRKLVGPRDDTVTVRHPERTINPHDPGNNVPPQPKRRSVTIN